MNILAEKLRTTDASVLDVLTKVNTELCREFHMDQVGCYQQPELVSRLNEEVHLLREAKGVNGMCIALALCRAKEYITWNERTTFIVTKNIKKQAITN